MHLVAGSLKCTHSYYTYLAKAGNLYGFTGDSTNETPVRFILAGDIFLSPGDFLAQFLRFKKLQCCFCSLIYSSIKQSVEKVGFRDERLNKSYFCEIFSPVCRDVLNT
jgi:hypothetical protein